ncbi:hypothetical protein J4714_14170 [Staphylococcus epidermidis]|nr:hypothetical protein [Staphylococcus epidermidis]
MREQAAWQHRSVLAHPLASSTGMLMVLKIALALSVAHFASAMWWRRKDNLMGDARTDCI